VTIVYAESSAVLSWLLGESGQQAILHEMSDAEQVVTSTLTIIDCSRALARARALKRLKEAEELAAFHQLDDATAAWHVLDISDRVADRARAAFPREPVRTLDALHLASALVFAEALGAVLILSLDDRVRENAAALGFAVAP
jgi:uncharacterized protein with PIN domain